MRRVYRLVDVGGRQVRVVFEVGHTARVAAAVASAGTGLCLADTHSVDLD